MEQSELRELEWRCIQEEWAYCRAACPLHVDARSFCLALKDLDFNKSRSILEKTMPVAGILGRVCEAPCELKCKRLEAGDAIQIGRLERFCVASTERKGKTLKIPDRGRRAVVLGCGLSGLTVAHDLARKGYRIEIYFPEQNPEQTLQKRFKGLVPEKVLKEEIQYLQKIGVSFTSRKCDKQLLTDLIEDKNLVYIGLDALDADILPFDLEQLDPKTLTTEERNIFVGGFSALQGNPEAIWDACDGRKAAVSIDRVTQNVSLEANREQEGPVPTRLVTSLEGVEPLPSQLPGKSEDDERALIKAEGARCLACECMICVRNCPYLEAFGSYPRSYARQIYNNESIVKGTHQANILVNSCMLCGLCTTLCPHDFPMADLCLGSRRRMVQKGKMPPSAHEFALKDLEFSQSEDFYLLRPDPELGTCAWVFFPGCQLCATHPEQVTRTYSWLRANLQGGVGLALACCGAPAHWSGREQIFNKLGAKLSSALADLDNPKLIVACPSCQDTLKHIQPQPSQISLWEVLAGKRNKLPLVEKSLSNCLIDPCTASNFPEVRQAVRDLVQKFLKEMSEPRLNATEAACCGYGGLLSNANPDLGSRVARERDTGCPEDDLTYCAICRDQLARQGKRAAHILDLFFPGDQDPYDRPATGLSVSRSNRRWLKIQVLQDFWNESGLAKDKYSSIVLQVSNEVRQVLEKRRILDSDIQQVISEARTSGQLFFDSGSKSYLASLRLGEVTFWVHYSQQDNGSMLIHTAYSHRMQIRKVSKKDSE